MTTQEIKFEKVPTAKEIRAAKPEGKISRSYNSSNGGEKIHFSNGVTFRFGENNLVTAKTWRKLQTMGFEPPKRDWMECEQEKAHWEGIAADMANPKQHGRVMMASILAGEGGGVFCWDYNKQKMVPQNELS